MLYYLCTSFVVFILCLNNVENFVLRSSASYLLSDYLITVFM
jgi:hypothetical protein